MRLCSQVTLESYLQETASLNALVEMAPSSRKALSAAAKLFPFLPAGLRKTLEHATFHGRASLAWLALVYAVVAKHYDLTAVCAAQPFIICCSSSLFFEEP